MLSALLRPSPRRAWRLSRPLGAALQDGNVSKARGVLSARCFGSSVGGTLKEEDKGPGRNSARETRILGALRAYKEINGNLLVPYAYVVPTGDIRWPCEAWGYRLGAGVSKLRVRAAKRLPPRLNDQLNEMDFVYEVYPFQWYEIIMPALRHYFKGNGHTDVPRDFVVPNGDDAWPRQTWDWKLGVTVHAIRNKNAYSQQVRESEEEIKEMKFCFEMSIAERDWDEKILPALRIYRRKFHHCLVKTSFKVPSASPWPRETWGLALGSIVSQIRVGKNYAEQATRDKDVLVQLGFSWDFYESNWKDRVFPALEVCAAEYGHFQHSQKFVVPRWDPWPKNVWGMRLGMLLYMMQYRGDYFSYIGRDAKRLEALGFPFELSDRAWEKKVVPLLETYAKLFGDKAIPCDFVIPSESPWPKIMWGVHLGIFVDRNRKYLTK